MHDFRQKVDIISGAYLSLTIEGSGFVTLDLLTCNAD
jgi:hypothetical protein